MSDKMIVFSDVKTIQYACSKRQDRKKKGNKTFTIKTASQIKKDSEAKHSGKHDDLAFGKEIGNTIRNEV